MSDQTIPWPIRDHQSADGIGWGDAREGDFVCYLDPSSRALGPVYRIEEVSEITPDRVVTNSRLVAVNGNATIAQGWEAGLQSVSFARAAWQVWRTEFDSAPANPLTDEAINAEQARHVLDVINRMITKHASIHGLCNEGVQDFRDAVNSELGFEALPQRMPLLQVSMRLSFNIPNAVDSDVTWEALESHLNATVQHFLHRDFDCGNEDTQVSFAHDSTEVQR